MRTRIYVDGKRMADLPTEVQMDKFLEFLKLFMHENEGGWKHIEIKKEESKNE